MKNAKIVALSVAISFLGILMFPSFSSAATIEELQTKINALSTQIQQLQAQIKTSQSRFLSAVFTKNLYYGLDDSKTDGEVSKLQKFLSQDPTIYPEGLITGYFGPLTQKAVKRWQVKQNIVSSGSPETTGYGVVGPKTREKLNALSTELSDVSISPTTQPAPIPSTTQENLTTQPTISTLRPTSGPVNTNITITGSGFTATGNRVKFGNLGTENIPRYSLNSPDGKTLVFTVPSMYSPPCPPGLVCPAVMHPTQPGTYNISVINANGTSNEVPFTVVGPSLSLFLIK